MTTDLSQAISLIKSGQKDQARSLLYDLLKADPHNEMAWLWLTETLGSDEQRIRALEQCLKANPESQLARKGLERLRKSQVAARDDPQPSPPAALSTPNVISEAPLASGYSPPPPTSTHSGLLAALPTTPKKRSLNCLEISLIGLIAILILGIGIFWLFPQFFPSGVVPTATIDRSVVASTASAIETVNAEARATLYAAQTAAAIPTDTATPIPATPTPRPVSTNTATSIPTSLYTTVISPDNASQLVELRRFVGHGDPIVVSVDFSPDGTLLATTGNDTNVRLWDTASGNLLATLRGHTIGMSSLAFSPDGTLLASGSADNTVRLWDVHTYKTVAILQGHTEDVIDVAFSPDGKLLASAGHDNAVRLWDVATHETVAILDHPGAVYSVAFSPDGAVLATSLAEGSPQVWLWDVKTNKHTATFTMPERADIVRELRFSSDGLLLAAATVNQAHPSIRLLDARTGKVIRSLEGHTLELNGIAFSPDGRLIASVSADSSVRVWDVQTGQELVTLRHDSNANSVAFNTAGTLIATAGSDDTARIWGLQP